MNRALWRLLRRALAGLYIYYDRLGTFSEAVPTWSESLYNFSERRDSNPGPLCPELTAPREDMLINLPLNDKFSPNRGILESCPKPRDAGGSAIAEPPRYVEPRAS